MRYETDEIKAKKLITYAIANAPTIESAVTCFNSVASQIKQSTFEDLCMYFNNQL